MRTIKESLAALHIQRRHKTDKDNRYRRRKNDWTKTRCARPSLTGVGHRDLGWALLVQCVFGKTELRHPSCATLGTCILRFTDFLFKFKNVQKIVKNIFFLVSKIDSNKLKKSTFFLPKNTDNFKIIV